MAKRVLIADDEANIVMALEFLLGKAGYEVRSVGTGAEALEAVERFRPDLLLLDVMMPAINGYEVCQRLRQDPRFAGLKILMLTAKGRELDMAKGLALGADAYVTKPFATKELLAEVTRLVGGPG